jgi:diguanylate cyclase (GGDEF)-like protein
MNNLIDVITVIGPAVGPCAFASGLLAGLPARRKLRAQRDAARQAATTDTLTGLGNRAGLTARLAKPAASEDLCVLLAMVDLDRFKQVNDDYGHDTGDHLLAAVAHRLAAVAVAWPDGYAARLGGDEFVLVATSAAPGAARRLGQDTITALYDPFEIGGVTLPVRASVGVVHAVPGDEPSRVLHAADLALYRAKRGGRDQVVEHEAPLSEASGRIGVRLRDMAELEWADSPQEEAAAA